MKHWPVVLSTLVAAAAVVLVLLQGGRVSDLEAQLQAAQRAKPVTVKTAPEAGPTVDVDALKTRLAAVEREARTAAALARMAGSRADIQPTEIVALAGDSGEESPVLEEIASLRADVDALLQGRGVETPEAKDTIRKEFQAARAEQRAARQARRIEQRNAWIDTFAEEAGLSDEQTTQVRGLMDGVRTARTETWEAMRAGEKTMAEAREEMRAARDEMNASLKELLGEEQFDTFMQNRPRGGGFGRRGRRGDGGGGGGGGRGDQ